MQPEGKTLFTSWHSRGSAGVAEAKTWLHGKRVTAGRIVWREAGDEQWTIELVTDAGTLLLSAGGAKLAIDGVTKTLPDAAEYPGLYRRFAALIVAGRCEIDLRPLELVADAFLLGQRVATAAFTFDG